MDRESVIRHLRAWADGIDPATGEALAANHPGQRPDTLRIVFAALALLEAQQSDGLPRAAAARPVATPAARNAGRPWSQADDASLAAAFDSGTPIGTLAAQMERTRGAITARLVKLGRIEPPPGLRLRGESSAVTPALTAPARE